MPGLREVGFRCRSQHEEDGILLYLFALIGTTDRRCVEIGAGDGMENNTANLVLHHRWTGLMIDGDEACTDKARRFYAAHPDTRFWPPRLVHAWVTAENVNALIADAGLAGDVDLLSIDVDGIDYWLWKALDRVRPRVVVTEINHLWGPQESVTVPYSPDFRAQYTEHGSDYAGASLAAFVKLAREKGYRLIGSNAFATNAFFLRSDIDCAALPEVDPATCFDHPRARFGMEKRLPGVRDREWQRV